MCQSKPNADSLFPIPETENQKPKTENWKLITQDMDLESAASNR
jgi:hypothetical protein